MKPKEIKIGRRIEHLLRTADNPDPSCNLSSSLDTAKKAEAMGLLKITLYRNEQFDPISADALTNETKLLCLEYELTDKGRKLREKLLSGAVKVKDSQRDEQLSWLLEQSACLHFEKTPEPHESYTWDSELQFLKNLGNTWMQHATDRLQIDYSGRHFFLYSDHDHYDSEDFNNGLFCEVIAEDNPFPIDITLSLGSSLVWPAVSLGLALNVKDSAREFFARAMTDYPRVVADLLDCGSSLKFQCNVPLENEPKTKRAKTIEWLKSYFDPASTDEEEEFTLETSFTPISTHAHIRRNFLTVVAFYESALSSLTPNHPKDLLLDFHKILCRSKPSRRDT